MLRLPDPCLVVLVGATGAGKSRWAARWFQADQIVSSDRLRAVVGLGERDQRASGDAFEVLELIVAKRLARRLTTVIDSTGLDAARRGGWRALAERHGVPLMWGPGAPRFEGRTLTVDAAVCYPRPLQERVPILVGGSGELRTLRLVARHADACNLFGDPANVRHKLVVLREHCAAEARDPAAVAVTHLAAARVIAAGAPREGAGAATAAEHVGRYRELAEAGVQTAIVGLRDDEGADSVRRFADVIAAFR